MPCRVIIAGSVVASAKVPKLVMTVWLMRLLAAVPFWVLKFCPADRLTLAPLLIK